MKRLSRISEIFAGLIILVVVVVFLISMLHTALSQSSSTYPIVAEFKDAGGIDTAADVTIKGVVVGKVQKVSITNDYNVRLVLRINSGVHVPINSKATITDSSFFSGRKIAIIPGDSKTYLSPNQNLTETTDYKYLEDKISSALFKN